MSNAGFVYVLINQAMPGLVKIGRTTGDVKSRAEELSRSTGVATPFIAVYSRYFIDCHSAEGFVHALLESRGHRLTPNREFFTAETSEAIDAVLMAPGPTSAPSLTTLPEAPGTSSTDDRLNPERLKRQALEGDLWSLLNLAVQLWNQYRLHDSLICWRLISSRIEDCCKGTDTTRSDFSNWLAESSSWGDLKTIYLGKYCIGLRQVLGFIPFSETLYSNGVLFGRYMRHQLSFEADIKDLQRLLDDIDSDPPTPSTFYSIYDPDSSYLKNLKVTPPPWLDLLDEANAHRNGLGDHLVDERKAISILKQAVRLGSSTASLVLGNVYRFQEPPDFASAESCYKDAVQGGCHIAYGPLAAIYQSSVDARNEAKCYELFFGALERSGPQFYSMDESSFSVMAQFLKAERLRRRGGGGGRTHWNTRWVVADLPPNYALQLSAFYPAIKMSVRGLIEWADQQLDAALERRNSRQYPNDDRFLCQALEERKAKEEEFLLWLESNLNPDPK